MNSYPPELLVQLAPVMFVAGLSDASLSNTETLDVEGHGQDQFTALAQRLRESLGAQRKSSIWASEATRKAKLFQVVFVDKIFQFPPRKIPDPTAPPTVHSPLSPLHPSSPLYPDGLIAPIWIRKHTSLVPSVFVLFTRLFEHTSPPPMPRSPLEPEGADIQKERDEREKEERRWDSELAKQIADRKKSTNERGIKLTVVLMASRKMLEEPSLDGRLTYIRRSSGLDSRAALFVLSPVSPAELSDFVKSLQQALYDPAIDYYTSHSKRVRRKRNRHTQSASSNVFPHGLVNANRSLPLRPEGWTVRYEYKMACFAEFRGETEVALKHYQDAHTALLVMFGSPTILQPRTKRWAEAKVLADTVNLKICKLFLYNSEHTLALSQHTSHVRRFCDLSTRVWGIGEDTFEYWSWLARQHRVFAELLEQGAHFSLEIPNHLPSPPTSTSTQASSEIDMLQVLGLNPSTAVMHPGFYYYAAAECTEQRRLMFTAALEAEASEPSISQAPGFQNEKRVDHLGTILELYTKAYELFKKNSPLPNPSQTQLSGRFTLWIAYKIARTYYTSGKYDMAIRFFERISKTYKSEKWEPILQPLLSAWYKSAQQLGDVDMSVRILVEMIAKGVGTIDTEDEGPLSEDLLAVLKSTVPTSEDPLIVDLTNTDPPFNCSVVFWRTEAKLGESVPFQITIEVPVDVDFSALPLVTLSIFLSDSTGPITVDASGPGTGEAEKTCVMSHVDHISASADGVEETVVKSPFMWRPGTTLVLSGTISSSVAQEIKFIKAGLSITEGKWRIVVPFNIAKRRETIAHSATWVVSDSPLRTLPIRRSNVSSLRIKQKPHQIRVSISHHAPAYLDEAYPIYIDVTNEDRRDLSISMDVLLQPGEDDQSNRMLIDDEESVSLIKGVDFGIIAPGATGCKVLKVVSSGSAGERMLDLSIQSRITDDSGLTNENERNQSGDYCEVLRTIEVPVVSAFSVSAQTVYARSSTPLPGPADLLTFEPGYWDNSVGGKALVTTVLECVDCTGACAVVVDKIRLVPETAQENTYSQILHNSLVAEDFPLELLPGDQFTINSELSIAPPEDYYADNEAVLPSPGYFVLQWSRLSPGGERGEVATTRIALPQLKPPSDGLTAVLHVPPLVHLHQPFTLELVISNRHPTRTACPSVSVEPDAASPSLPSTNSSPQSSGDSFVIAGMRGGRLPVLLPGAETRACWRLIPLECGTAVRLPNIKVRDLRTIISAPQREREQVQQTQMQAQTSVALGENAGEREGAGGGTGASSDVGDEVPIIDARWDGRNEDGSDAVVFPLPQISTSADEANVNANMSTGMGINTNTSNTSNTKAKMKTRVNGFTIIVSPA